MTKPGKAGGVMAQAARNAARAKPKAARSDSSSDEMESTRSRVSSSDDEIAPIKKAKKTAVPEERAAKVINQSLSLYTIIYINMI